MNEKELQDIEFEYAPYTDEGSQQVKALVAEVRRLKIDNVNFPAKVHIAMADLRIANADLEAAQKIVNGATEKILDANAENKRLRNEYNLFRYDAEAEIERLRAALEYYADIKGNDGAIARIALKGGAE